MTPKCAQSIFLLHEDSEETMGESSDDCNYSGNWGSIEDKSRCPVAASAFRPRAGSPNPHGWHSAHTVKHDVFSAPVLLGS